MNNKFLGLLAASAAVVGGVFAAAPAHAVQQDVPVEITISPVLYLRTFSRVSLPITNQDLGAVDKDVDNRTTNGSTAIDRITPASLTGLEGGTVTKQVPQLFAVWSNSANGVTVTVAPVGTGTLTHTTNSATKATITNVVTTLQSTGNPTLNTPLIGGADITFEIPVPRPGVYTGASVRVEALPNF